MEATLELITKIKEALGGDRCDVTISSNHIGGLTVRVYWSGRNYNVEVIFTSTEIKSLKSELADRFIRLAKKHRKMTLLEEIT